MSANYTSKIKIVILGYDPDLISLNRCMTIEQPNTAVALISIFITNVFHVNQ